MSALSKNTLFARLAEGHAPRITVVTPNTRLAQALTAEFDSHQVASRLAQAAGGLLAWEAADVLPFSSFVQRLWEDALYSDVSTGLPMLLTPAQEQLLWQQVVSQGGRELLWIKQTAEQCRRAWDLVHAWRIGHVAGNEDAAAFNAWAAAYKAKTASDVDAARLPDLAAGLLKEQALKKPKLLVAYAFDILPAQTREFFEACEKNGIEVQHCQPEKKVGSPLRTPFPSGREELEAAAKWARARLEANGAESAPRIGVVIPDLQQRRKEVVRVFSRVMQPAFNLPAVAKTPMPFNVSLGLPLADYPIVRAALAILELSFQEIPFVDASRLLRSPFLAGAESEMAARARLDAKIRRDIPATVSLAKLIGFVEGCPVLRVSLEKVFECAKTESQSPHDWARHFSTLLEAAGFPGERGLDSDEFQARAKWHETLGEFAKLERVVKKISVQQAYSLVQDLCRKTLFQPESGDAPIQVLGILESAGVGFEHLWVSGLTDERWPLAANANPFLPVSLQKKAGIPEASAEGSLALDRRITEGWLGAADEVVFSHPEKEGDRDLSPSPLIAHLPAAPLALPTYPRFRDLVFQQKRLSSVEDTKAPPVSEKRIRGGTRVLADQAACPFRAFARWRLGAQVLESPADGLDAAKRGSLLHALMKHLWLSLKDSDSLQGNLEPAIASAAAAAVKELEHEGRYADLERERLARLAHEWLEVEKARAPFEVVFVERKLEFEVAGLELSGRIDRMDRVDGVHVLIDYKTSRAPSPKHWEPPRPDDPQLPIYAIAAKEDIEAVAFAKLRPGDMKFMGFSRSEKLIPNVKVYTDWRGLFKLWREEAGSLGKAFAAGEARVDPKRELTTCRNCDLQTLCRVYEKTNALRESGEAE